MTRVHFFVGSAQLLEYTPLLLFSLVQVVVAMDFSRWVKMANLRDFITFFNIVNEFDF
jgi:hypothetical protein